MGHDDTSNNKSKKYKIIILGLIIHFLLLFAVFDIYFASPLDHGMRSVKSITKPPAKRLVIFVADGLRAEAVLDNKLDRIPFLKSVIENNGSWGVAHTRVPTESRPGHVALLAGIYEDPSAIMKGWKANPVLFDSVINQSSNAWAWGSPDILNIFNKDNLPHIRMHTYSSELEDFGEQNTGLLDMWVFNRVEKFLAEEVDKCMTACEDFHASGNVFFLHLLGIDTAGHGYKPHSKEYVQNIQLVDRNVRKISQMFEKVFNDKKTAYVFTADHGMTDWGSHGAGSPHETEAPLVAWGAGIRRQSHRQDLKQINLAPLLSSIIGTNIPSNSLGVVPLEYIDMPEESLAEIQMANTLQLLELFNIKRLRTEANALIFIPYKGLTSDVLDETLVVLEKMQEDQEFKGLINECRRLVEVLINGLDYYHNYYQYPLLISISIGFIGWILFLVASVLDSQVLVKSSCTSPGTKTMVVNMVPVGLCYMQNFPLSYYVYFWFPFGVFSLLLGNQQFFIFNSFRLTSTRKIINVLIYVTGIELLVLGFFTRTSFSILSMLIGIWILLPGAFGKFANRRDKILWLILCLILSIFPLFPVMKTTFNLSMYCLGAITWVLLFYEMFYRLRYQYQFKRIGIRYSIFYVQFSCLVLAIIYSISIEYGLIANNSSIKYFSWTLLVIPICLIPFTSTFLAVRLLGTFFGFAPFYLLVSSNFEALFSAIYVAVLCNWLLIESKSFSASDSTNLLYYVNFDAYKSKTKITPDMFRRTFLFMGFIFIGFFGTGNIASLNSFDPMWVRAFLTVFSPFKMMGLILLKIMVPFLFTCCVFRAINSIGKENILQMFCIILIYSDLMVLQFLYLITNVGSWLDIGSSLSHFIIMEGFVIILLLLYGLAHLLTTTNCIKQK
ncbi:GPI ethanolamine phosphate transferase 1-like isoform X1 [Euwallacea fornicatus]|uniref:GPI ethanolamine phosphate transferase 1-like isoform X1 n=1 Tax=Euwallacea fornicatus TaxID=995702 RepID=UPI00338F8977